MGAEKCPGPKKCKHRTVRVPLDSIDEAYKWIKTIKEKARYQNNGKNATSSRGHLVFCIRVTLNDDRQPSFIVADLAGQEDGADTVRNAKVTNKNAIAAN